MNRLIRFWNQNRKKVITIIGLIVFLILIIQFLDNMVSIQKRNTQANIKEETIQEDLPGQSIITGEKVEIEIVKENVDIINEFIEYCNNNDTKNAYNLLSEECKKTLFETEEDFVEYYYNVIFKDKRFISIENFRNFDDLYTYEVEYYNDVLADGKVQGEDRYKDYITIDKSSNKLNINNFIGSKTINKSSEYNGVKIEVCEQQIYKDYEKYVISVENTTDKKILLDTRKNSRSIYVVANNTKYSAFANEILDTMYQIPAYYTKTYTIKFDKIYNPDNISKKIGFSDIVTDFENYDKNPEQEKSRTRIIVQF